MGLIKDFGQSFLLIVMNFAQALVSGLVLVVAVVGVLFLLGAAMAFLLWSVTTVGHWLGM